MPQLGEDGMADVSSRSHSHPNKTPQHLVKRIVHLRIRKRFGPVQIAGRLGMAALTVHAVLTRCHLNLLTHVDVKTGEPARRYQHDHPGSLIHVDVQRLGNIPDGGGWRYVGREQGGRNRAETDLRRRQGANRGPLMRHAYVHTVMNDLSCIAYAEIHDDERAETAIGVLQRAVSWLADRGVRVERVLSDNGPAYRSHAWRDTCTELGINHKRTHPYRPQTNGKIERFHRTMSDSWADVSTTTQNQPAALHSHNGCTSTITTGPTQPSGNSQS